MMAEFSRKYPRVKFDVYTANADQIKHRMDNGLTDIGLLLEPVDMERYEYIRLPVKERWVAVTPSGVPLARHEYVTAKELADIPVIMPSRQKVHDEVASWFGNYYEKLSIIGATNFSTNSALIVRAGMGYALIIEGGLPFLEDSNVCMRPLIVFCGAFWFGLPAILPLYHLSGQTAVLATKMVLVHTLGAIVI